MILADVQKGDQVQIMVSDSFSHKQRAVFASQHIVSAALFTRLCGKLEVNYKGHPPSTIPSDVYDEQKAYVTAAIFASVSFLEATINELFVDAVELEPGALAGTLIEHLDPGVKELMADMWKLGIPRTASFQILQKFDTALALARKQRLKEHLYRDVTLVVTLRNALTHFEPTWTMESLSTPIQGRPNPFYYEIYKETPSAKIKSLAKFSNPLALQQEPFFPNQCLCHRCAKWAVTSCVNFAKAFFERMGINNYPPPSVMGLPLT